MAEQEITVREAARLCGRNPETVRRWIWEGKLPARKLGNQLFILRTDLESFARPVEDEFEHRHRRFDELMDKLRDRWRREGKPEIDVIAALDESRATHPRWPV